MFAGLLNKCGLGVEGVEVTGAADHVEEDAGLGFGGEVTGAGGHGSLKTGIAGGLGGLGKESVLGEKVGERGTEEAVTGLPEELAAGAVAGEFEIEEGHGNAT